MKTIFWSVLVLALSVLGCTHRGVIEVQAGPVMEENRPQHSQHKRVAVYLGAIRHVYKIDIDGHDYYVVNPRLAWEQDIAAVLSGRVADLQFFYSTTPPAGFDAYVTVGLSMDGGGILGGHHCDATVTVRIVDARGRTVGEKTDKDKSTFGPMAGGLSACRSSVEWAMLNTHDALADIDKT